MKNYYEKIERYLLDEMDSDEISKFKKELEAKPNLKEKTKVLSVLIRGIKNKESTN